jgi:hypothetical protein
LVSVHKEIGIDIVVACSDAVYFKLNRSPDDSLKFAKRLFDFCPDLRSSDDVSSFAEKLRNARVIDL